MVERLGMKKEILLKVGVSTQVILSIPLIEDHLHCKTILWQKGWSQLKRFILIPTQQDQANFHTQVAMALEFCCIISIIKQTQQPKL